MFWHGKEKTSISIHWNAPARDTNIHTHTRAYTCVATRSLSCNLLPLSIFRMEIDMAMWICVWVCVGVWLCSHAYQLPYSRKFVRLVWCVCPSESPVGVCHHCPNLISMPSIGVQWQKFNITVDMIWMQSNDSLIQLHFSFQHLRLITDCECCRWKNNLLMLVAWYFFFQCGFSMRIEDIYRLHCRIHRNVNELRLWNYSNRKSKQLMKLIVSNSNFFVEFMPKNLHLLQIVEGFLFQFFSHKCKNGVLLFQCLCIKSMWCVCVKSYRKGANAGCESAYKSNAQWWNMSVGAKDISNCSQKLWANWNVRRCVLTKAI